MATIKYPVNSPYFATPQLSWRIGRYQFRAVPPDSGDQPYTVTTVHQFRPDRLAFDLYGNPSLWWVFATRNPFLRTEPVWDFIAGLEIMVSSADYLHRVLGV